jgi:CSLREA domain-containing protein
VGNAGERARNCGGGGCGVLKKGLLACAVIAAALFAVPAVHAATFTVTTTADTGAGSLRQAILDSNGSIGIPDTIDFNIAGAGPHVIQPVTALPQVTDSVTIDGSAELSPGGFPLVTVDGGAGVAPSLFGLDVAPTNAAGTTIRALAFTRWDTGNGSGLRLAGAGVQGVFGSLFGLDSTGTALGNYAGVFVAGGSGHQIGGVAAGDRNIASGNVTGIALNATQTNAIGNWIGVGLDGTTAMANSIQGILVQATNNTIGSRSAGAGNRIRSNGIGVRVVSGALNTIAGNSIDQNSGVGIDLGLDNVTPNDAGDGDSGPNTLQNFPVLTSAVKSGSTLDVSGTIDTITGQEVTIDYYASAACDPSGNGEGDRFVASVLVNADQPNKPFENGVDGSVVNVGDALTATTTDSNGNTSEFSACFTVTGSGETFVVNSAADPGDGTCDGTCTLRDAIIDANATPTADTITFAIGTGAQVILPLTELPAITSPVTIDGTTQPGFGSSPLIQVDGANGTSGILATGLQLAAGADGSLVRALSVTQFSTAAVSVAADDVDLMGNWIGIQPGSGAGGGTGTGVEVAATASGTEIGTPTGGDRNVVTDWSGSNIHVDGAAGTSIRGNYIGLLPDGNTGSGTSSSVGILVDNGATGTAIGGIPINGNVIADATDGIHVQSANGTTVHGNVIGLEADGVTPVPQDIGVFLGDADNSVIGSVANGGNTIVAADDSGVLLINGSNSNTVAANFIGVNAAGTPMGNGSGIRQLNGSGNNTIGPANEIAHNSIEGVQVIDTGIRINGNSIHSNGGAPGASGLGIDLGGNGVTPNDGEDTDTGPNNGQNFPVLSSATLSGGELEIQGVLDTVGGTFRIEVFASEGCDPSGFGEGAQFVGFTNLVVDQPNEALTISALAAPGVDAGEAITTTATDAAGNTSEFSACVTVVADDQTLTVNAADDTNDGSCDATHCSLREAVLASNA